jgi:hypothetical protein
MTVTVVAGHPSDFMPGITHSAGEIVVRSLPAS